MCLILQSVSAISSMWGPVAGVVIASILMWHFPDSKNIKATPTFCPAGRGSENLSTTTSAETLTIATFNAEWLFDGVNDAHRSFETADAHIENIGKWMAHLKTDVLNVVELEDCRVLERVSKWMAPEGDIRFYVGPSADTATKQTIGVVSRVSLLSPGIMFDGTTRASYPQARSSCGYSSSKTKTSGVSKHWYGVVNTKQVGEILFVGTHLKAFPNQPKSCSKREAQARVLVDIIKKHGSEKGRHVVLFGDLNDFDSDHLDVSENEPTSNVLSTLKSELSLTNGWKFVKKEARWSWKGVGFKDSALDHILISNSLITYVESVWVDRNESFSDHRPLVVRFRWS